MDLGYPAARLQACDLSACEGMCCHDGVYLEPHEVRALRRLVFRRRVAFPHVPDRFVVPGEGGAPKTATRPHDFRQADFPPHFPKTRCVFALPDARCALQALAEADGMDPWTYKPRACWMHPLREGAAGPLPPPEDPAADWDRAPGYPGYVCHTRCGGHRPHGEPWEAVLHAELARWQSERPAR